MTIVHDRFAEYLKVSASKSLFSGEPLVWDNVELRGRAR